MVTPGIALDSDVILYLVRSMIYSLPNVKGKCRKKTISKTKVQSILIFVCFPTIYIQVPTVFHCLIWFQACEIFMINACHLVIHLNTFLVVTVPFPLIYCPCCNQALPPGCTKLLPAHNSQVNSLLPTLCLLAAIPFSRWRSQGWERTQKTV